MSPVGGPSRSAPYPRQRFATASTGSRFLSLHVFRPISVRCLGSFRKAIFRYYYPNCRGSLTHSGPSVLKKRRLPDWIWPPRSKPPSLQMIEDCVTSHEFISPEVWSVDLVAMYFSSIPPSALCHSATPAPASYPVLFVLHVFHLRSWAHSKICIY